MRSEVAPPGRADGGWHVFGGNRAAGSTGASRSFSGQGREVWENASVARNVVPRTQSLSALQTSFRPSSAINAGLHPTQNFVMGKHFIGGPGTNPIVPIVGSGRNQQFGNTFIFFPSGCWSCGFGFGFGFGWWPGWWGWGWGWPGFWGWNSPWWGWPGYGYGYGSYGYPYTASVQSDSYGYDNTNPSSTDQNEYPAASTGTLGPGTAADGHTSNLRVPILIYMKDGAVYSVRDSWLRGGELHYVLMNGKEGAVNLDDVDLQRTNEENAKSGVKFILKSEPNLLAPDPDENVAPPNQDGSAQPSAPPTLRAPTL